MLSVSPLRISTYDELMTLQCEDPIDEWVSEVPSRAKLTTYQSTSSLVDRIVGVAFNGVPIFPASGEKMFDPLFPSSYDSVNISSTYAFDVCLGNNDYISWYHYYSYSPCIQGNQIKKS